MNSDAIRQRFSIFLLIVFAGSGCESQSTPTTAQRSRSRPTTIATADKPDRASGDTPADAFPGEAPSNTVQTAAPVEKKEADDPPGPEAKRIGKNVFFEIRPDKKRHVVVSSIVCLREGSYGLECLLCRRRTKEHESVLSTEADARTIHSALEATGAKPGKPVQFDPKFQAPTGAPIKVTLEYKKPDGTAMRLPAQEWVRNTKTKKSLDQNWVFAGSQLVPDPFGPDKPPVYLATSEGAYISVSNVPTAMLDLPIESPKHLEGRNFAPFTERIPPLETRVFVILEPLEMGKK